MKNTFKHNYKISRKDREDLHKHNSSLVWFTGLSGSGKSTLANLLEQELYSLKLSTFVLDGDNIRQGLNRDLNFSNSDRSENIRRISEVAKLLIEAGVLTIAAFVSPFKKDRDMVKNIVGSDNFIEVYINASLEECEKRDTKGLYKKARLGEIKNMTGISSPYEAPENPTLEINTNKETIDESMQKIKKCILEKLKYGKLHN
ncbi:MAG: adenylyl-sulfate kinase [Flavobacteriales bacterium]|nr:adenylyl-sulfate kinase [Flavobacteriales bacterium]|tara:strand:+ start:7463 stop:8068 length:606 start_codon:yes stop_codon:yes gene_type:complete